MRVLCAPSAFKESLAASDAAAAMSAGAIDAGLPPNAVHAESCPVADGGDGTLEVLGRAHPDAEFRTISVLGPLGLRAPRREATFGLIAGRRIGIVELAAASGLALLPPDRRDPLITTTYGTGELIAAAAAAGARTIIIGLGGSATVDGATGLVQALDGRFFDADDQPLDAPLAGGDLLRIARFVPPPDPPHLRVACDVRNPLLGPRGAAAVYGPQKGAAPEQVAQLERGLTHLASLFDVDPETPGAGAAGGAGFGLLAMANATLEPGIDLVLETIRFEERCRDADLVLTGEGQLDAQSLDGKAAIGVARAAAASGVPTVAIVGRAGPGAEQCVREHGGPLESFVSLAERFGAERAMKDAAALVREAAREIVAARR